MSNGETLYLTLVLGVFFSFIAVLAYGIISSAQARKARAGLADASTATASRPHTPNRLKAA
ncbi:MAG: hypothetical protein LCH56_04505 [Proteobacteria bacterium]|nr:hypothetical protein [Pseudomonadota bacterium]